MLSLQEKADKLHDLGHEVAAAALRRAAMMEHPFDISKFRRFRRRDGHGTTKFPVGYVSTSGEAHNLKADDTPGLWAVMRVGKTLGPITSSELALSHSHQVRGLDEHPLASGAHGLHHSDPHPESFTLLKQHIEHPGMWPFVADKFEEDGGSRALAMAKLLRSPTKPNKNGAYGSRGPVTWPVRPLQVGPHGYPIGLGKHYFDIPTEKAKEIYEGLK